MSSPNWDELGFGLDHTAPNMYVAKWTSATGWVKHGVQPFGNLSMPPTAQVLNYGQALFEGLKAHYSAKDRIVLFRPLENAKRMQDGANRMSMTPLPEAIFLEGITEIVKANSTHIPPCGRGSMYIRPLLLGTGPTLGLAPASEVTFVVYTAAVSAYFKSGSAPLRLKIEDKAHRAAPFGVGAAKCAGNYGSGLKALLAAKAAGFNDVLYLDARSDTYLEELSAANIFIAKGNSIRTPPLKGTVLAGITRKSIMQLATEMGYDVVEENVAVEDALSADEVFATGTAVVLCPVGCLTYKGKDTLFQAGGFGPIAQRLHDALLDVNMERVEDKRGWVVPLDDMGAVIQAAGVNGQSK